MKLLVTGASGLLGSAIVKELHDQHEITGTYLVHPVDIPCTMKQLDITKPEQCKQIIEEVDPDLIIHTAALTKLDECEEHPELTQKVNVEGTKNIVEAKGKRKLIHISTDYVFDGYDGNYTEQHLANPLSIYAKSKFAAEQLIPKEDLIVRMTPFGWNVQSKQCFAEWVLEHLREGKPVKLFHDQIYSPILTTNLARVLLEDKDQQGILHIGGAEAVSRLAFGKKMAKVFGLSDEQISSMSIKDFPFKAPRPQHVNLDSSKCQALLQTHKLLTIEEALEEWKKQS